MGRPLKVRSQVKKPELLPLAKHIQEVLADHQLNPLQFARLVNLVSIKSIFYNLLACETEPNRVNLSKIANGLRLLTGNAIYTRSYLDAMIDTDLLCGQAPNSTTEEWFPPLFSNASENDNDKDRLIRGVAVSDDSSPSPVGAKEFGKLLRAAMEAVNPPLNAVALADFLNAIQSDPPLLKISFIRLQQILRGEPAPTPDELKLLLRFLITAVPDGGNYERFLNMVYPPSGNLRQNDLTERNGELNGTTHLRG